MKSNFFASGSDAVCQMESHYPECGRLCGADQATHLITRLGIAEGDVLDYITKHPLISLNQLIRSLDWQPCLISMVIGLLIREGHVQATEYGNDVLIKRRLS